VFANGGSGLIGKSGRKTANVCDKHAKETIRNIVTDFTAVAFIILLRKTRRKVPKEVPKGSQGALSALIDRAQPRPHSAHFHGN